MTETPEMCLKIGNVLVRVYGFVEIERAIVTPEFQGAFASNELETV